MIAKNYRRWALFVTLTGAIFFVGCHKQVAKAPPTPAATPAPPAVPTVTLNASPDDITEGGTTTLTWSSSNATRLTLTPEVGSVSDQGSRQVNPEDSTTYTITAVGDGGKAEASARVTVNMPPATTATSESLDDLFQQQVKDAFFNYDRSLLRPDAQAALTKSAEFLNLHKNVEFTVEGHCDERGSEEYNLGLGDRRASAAKKYMVSLGIAPDRIQTTSYGKEHPFCTGHDETCWQENRRAHLVMAR